MVTDYSNLASTANNIIKSYYKDPVKEQLNNSTLLMKRIQRNTTDIQGGNAVIALHTARNYGTGARPNGQGLPVMGTQTHKQATTTLKYNYGRFKASGPDILNTRGNRGAFVRLIDSEVQGLTNDMKKDINRQLFADGSGILAFVDAAFSGTAGTTSGTLTISPYLWSPAAKYFDTTSMEIGTVGAEGSYATYQPTEADTADSPWKVNVASTTYTEGSTNSLAFTCTAAYGNYALAQGDAITKWRAGFQAVSNTFVRREMMGLDGIIHDTDLAGDANWQYGRQGAAVLWNCPETAQTVNLVNSSGTNNLQAVDAADNTFWRSKVYDNAGVRRALTIGMLDEAYGYQRTVVGVTPTLIVTTYKIRNKYAALLAQDRRYVNTMSLDGGFSAVEYNGIPLTDDPDSPSGRIYMVSEPNLQLYVGDDFNWIESGSGDVLHYISGYDAFEAVLRYYAELGTDRRNAHCKIVDILES